MKPLARTPSCSQLLPPRRLFLLVAAASLPLLPPRTAPVVAALLLTASRVLFFFLSLPLQSAPLLFFLFTATVRTSSPIVTTFEIPDSYQKSSKILVSTLKKLWVSLMRLRLGLSMLTIEDYYVQLFP
ncbi:hypothetical protein ACOSQ2_019612 [Xanthoceras sorbifolium]